MGEEENCGLNIMGNSKNSKLTCNKKSVNCNNVNSNSSGFEYTKNSSTNVYQQTNANFSSSEMSDNSTVAVAQAITTSTDILITNCPTPLSKSNSSTLPNTISNENSLNVTTNPSTNGLEFTQTPSNTMTPIDKLYSMQSSYFNNITPDNCENCLTNN